MTWQEVDDVSGRRRRRRLRMILILPTMMMSVVLPALSTDVRGKNESEEVAVVT